MKKLISIITLSFLLAGCSAQSFGYEYNTNTTSNNPKVSIEEFGNKVATSSDDSQLKITPFSSNGKEGIQLQDENGVAYGIKHVKNKPRVSSMDYLYDIAEGNISGHTAFSKFGRVSGISNNLVDIWAGEGGTPSIYTFATTTERLSIVSTSASDSSAGTGIRTFMIVGLDSNYNEIQETVLMNGITATTTTQSFLRVNFCYALTAGSVGTAVGTITVKDISLSRTYSSIEIGLTGCRTLVYTVPAAHTLYLTSINIASGKGGNSTNLNAVIFTPKYRLYGSSVFLPAGELLSINGDTIRILEVPGVFPGKTDIKMSVQGDYASGSSVCVAATRGWIEDN